MAMAAQPDNTAGNSQSQRRRSVETLRDRYQSAVRHALADDPESADTLPQVLMQVCADLLPTTGAGLSLTGKLRIPLGASSADVAEAERLQTSLGEGPCLSATAESRALVANADQIALQWPVFAGELRRRTPFKSVAALPLMPSNGSWLGAIDLYSTDPGAPFGPIDELQAAVAAPIMEFMLGHDGWSADLLEGGANRTAARRMTVWTAIGLVMASAGVEHDDALALLRGFTFRHELDLDTAAELLVSRTIPSEAVIDAD